MQILKPAIEAEERVNAAAEALSSRSHGTLKFSNHVYDYIKTSIETRDFDQALSDGFEIFTQDAKTSVYVLRKAKKENLEVRVSC